MRKPPRVYDSADPFQRETRQSFEHLAKQEIVNGRFFANIALTTTPTRISHGLGRAPKGWLISDITAATTVRRDTTETEQTRYLTLIAGAACTISLWIY